MIKRLRLNDKVVREAPPEQSRDYQIFDAKVRDFTVCIYRSGNAGEPAALVSVHDSTLAENALDNA